MKNKTKIPVREDSKNMSDYNNPPDQGRNFFTNITRHVMFMFHFRGF